MTGWAGHSVEGTIGLIPLLQLPPNYVCRNSIGQPNSFGERLSRLMVRRDGECLIDRSLSVLTPARGKLGFAQVTEQVG